mgnify:CR=1 FL=1
MKIKKGDKVVVIAGKSRGEKGTVMRAMPKENKVIIEGVNMMKKHQKATRRGGKGQLVERAMPLHVSNVQVVDPKTGKGTRVRIAREKGGMTRVAVKSGTTLK